VGIILYDRSKAEMKTFLKQVKKLLLNAFIAKGVCQATFSHIDIMKNCEYVDFVICSEGEKTFLKLTYSLCINSPLSKINGLTYKQESKLIVNDDRPFLSKSELDNLPYPS
jgi:radical SAM superfamily enzyme YgiQ (UPF0313 family)